ncbi:hypothetical protein [Paenibacillus phytohabitans]|uniref:hypothetical protein n=1 Tax=Paenibacillus phytohabitans TaxID=2654978 RepID=UPI00300BC0A6
MDGIPSLDYTGVANRAVRQPQALVRASTRRSIIEAVSRTTLEGHIGRVIERMKDMRGSIQETAPIGIFSMDNWEWPQGVGLFALYSY